MDSEQDEIDGMEEEANSTGEVGAAGSDRLAFWGPPRFPRIIQID